MLSLVQFIMVGFTIFISAFIGSLIGLGGGFLMVPLLSIVVGLPIHEAIGLSLISIVGVSSSASLNYILNGDVDFKIGSILELATVLGVYFGAHLALITDQKYLYILFGIVLLYVGYMMFKGGGVVERFTYREVSPKRLLSGAAISFIAGLLSGLLGVGGGILKVPIMTLYLGLPMKIAIGTSEYMISITSFTGSYIYLMSGKIDLRLLGIAYISSIFGAQLGSRAGIRAGADILRKVFVGVIIIFAFMMLVRGVSI